MLETGRSLIRNVLEAFGKRYGERSNCPKCDGSGLFHSRKRSWNPKAYTNDPCLFCEGVGVMPLYGLRGFLLGRASASLRTEDLRKAIASPLQLPLCLAKYPDAKCKVATFKHSGKMQELLYSRTESPSWLIDAANELAVASAVENSEHDDEGVHVIMSDVSEGSKRSPRRVLQISLDSSGLPTDCDQYKTMNSSKKVEEADTESWSKSTNCRRTRFPRRNRIREQAEKEARQRARFLSLKPSNSENSTSPTQSDQSDANWISSSGWKELSSNWLAEETALLRQSIRSAKAETHVPPNRPSVNQVLYARLVDKLRIITNFVKPRN